MEVFSKSRSSLSEAKSESISSSETLGIDKHLIDSPWLSVSSNDVAVLSLYKLIESYFNKRLKALSCNFNQSEISIYLSSPVQYLFKFSIEAVYDDLIPSEFEESTNYGYVAIHLFSVNRRITDPIKNKICNLRDFWAYLLCMDSLIKRDFIDAFKNNNSLSDSSLNAYDGVQFHAELEALYSCKEIQKARQELCFIPDDKIKYSGLASEVDEDTDFEHSSINHLFLEKVNAGTSKLGKRRTGNCNRCGGSGYIARYRHIENGRCFLCNRK